MVIVMTFLPLPVKVRIWDAGALLHAIACTLAPYVAVMRNGTPPLVPLIEALSPFEPPALTFALQPVPLVWHTLASPAMRNVLDGRPERFAPVPVTVTLDSVSW